MNPLGNDDADESPFRFEVRGSALVPVLVAVYVWYMNNRPDLNVWHTADLDAEFTAESPVDSFAGYLALEEQLFKQLDERVYAKTQLSGQHLIKRYNRGSLSDPGRWTPNWNRSFEMPAEAPRAGVLLLHGLSDSPYSLRSLGQQLNQAGAQVLGLRDCRYLPLQAQAA